MQQLSIFNPVTRRWTAVAAEGDYLAVAPLGDVNVYPTHINLTKEHADRVMPMVKGVLIVGAAVAGIKCGIELWQAARRRR